MCLLVLYGSQTGTAQDVAEHIWRVSKRYSFTGSVISMNDYPVCELIKERIVVFVVATTGQGEEPDNMKPFWKFLLRKNLPTNSLQNLRFACLGLGDSSYLKYNFAAKKLNKRLIQLSASQILPLGLCDDQHDHGICATFLPWLQNLWIQLQSMYNDVKEVSVAITECFKWHVEECVDKKSIVSVDNLIWPLKDKCFKLKLMDNQRTTSKDHFQDVRLLKFLPAQNVTWSPGDILNVRPCNSEEKVQELFNIFSEHNLGFNRNTLVTFKQIHKGMQLPFAYQHPITLGLVVKFIWDLNAIPRQRSFELLAINCKDDMEKEKLVEFSTFDGLEDLIQYVNKPKRSILEVLYDFRSAASALTLAVIFELFQIIQPRSYSIASVPETGTLDLLVAVVEYKTKLSKPRLGLCSNWLKHLTVNSEICATLKSGTIKFPSKLEIPIIMVSPGTGIAPFRSLLLRREALTIKGIYSNDLVVFFGCRSEHKDFHCRSDFERFEQMKLAKFYKAFSRDQNNKIYVQHLIANNSELLRKLVTEKNGVILVAGSSNNMPKAVKEAFIEVMGGNDYIETMIRTYRYQEETWA